MVLLVNLFEILFAFMLAAASPTPLTAANLLPFMLPILFIVSGIIVPHSTMPNPWRDFVYYVNPITYYVKGQLGSVLHGEPVICGDSDTAFFNPPPNETCQSYAGAWVTQSGGYLTTPDATSNCGYCQYSNGDQYLATLNIDYNFRWQSFGIFLGFVIFNAVMSYGCYWYFRIRGYGLGLGYVTGKASAMYNAITRKSSQKSA